MTRNAARPGARERRKEEKRARLREAAWELFCSQGYEATTTKQIAARAGVASGTLFLYARDKADLLFLVFHDRLATAVDEGMRTLPQAPLLDQLEHLFGAFLRTYAEAPHVARWFVKELPGANGPNAQTTNQLTFALLHHLAGLIQQAQARGEIVADVAPVLLSQNLFALYFFTLLGWLSGLVTLETALPHLRSSLALQLRGLAAKKS
jgi:TetR/AcrR family transcriptional regulator, cholesterol catabolism regulator